MGSKTPLYDKHVEAGARIVDFGGWDMPLHYGSQKEEHHAVRQHAGVFDVSHMTIVDLSGVEVKAFLQMLVANDVAKLKDHGKALYTCMLNSRWRRYRRPDHLLHGRHRIPTDRECGDP